MIKGHILRDNARVVPVQVRALPGGEGVSVKLRTINTDNKTNFVPARYDKMLGQRCMSIEHAFERDLGAYQRLLAQEVVFFPNAIFQEVQ